MLKMNRVERMICEKAYTAARNAKSHAELDFGVGTALYFCLDHFEHDADECRTSVKATLVLLNLLFVSKQTTNERYPADSTSWPVYQRALLEQIVQHGKMAFEEPEGAAN